MEAKVLEEHPRSAIGYVGATVVAVLAIVLALVVVGSLVGNPIHVVTVVGVVAGAVAAYVGTELTPYFGGDGEPPWTQFWEAYFGRGRPREYTWVGKWLHVVAGSLAGGLYPSMVRQVAGLSGQYFAELPLALVTALAWSAVLFALAAAVYHLTDTVAIGMENAGQWRQSVGFFLTFGIVLGLLVGSSRAVWFPLVGLRQIVLML